MCTTIRITWEVVAHQINMQVCSCQCYCTKEQLEHKKVVSLEWLQWHELCGAKRSAKSQDHCWGTSKKAGCFRELPMAHRPCDEENQNVINLQMSVHTFPSIWFQWCFYHYCEAISCCKYAHFWKHVLELNLKVFKIIETSNHTKVNHNVYFATKKCFEQEDISAARIV